jgi:cytosine/adenosine deaminase-related metal-dependent hydrolase
MLEVLGLADKIGTLDVGTEADIVVFTWRANARHEFVNGPGRDTCGRTVFVPE